MLATGVLLPELEVVGMGSNILGLAGPRYGKKLISFLIAANVWEFF